MRSLILGAGLTLALAMPASAENPSTGNPGAENPSAENPSTGNPGAENPSAENPSTGNPSAGNPSAGNPSAGNPSAEQDTSPDQSSSTVQQQVQKNLSAAGYTDIRVMPRSFLVQATDPNGNPTMMIINPNSVTAVKQIGGGGSGNNTAMRQSAELTSGQKQKIQQAVADQPAEQAPPNFQPSVGTTVPGSIELKSLPSSASNELPASMQDNKFAKLNDNNIIIADPSSRQVVAVINPQGSEQ